ncbi:MAG: hypothetical protein ACI81V_001404, partial [Lentimonas sp.]
QRRSNADQHSGRAIVPIAACATARRQQPGGWGQPPSRTDPTPIQRRSTFREGDCPNRRLRDSAAATTQRLGTAALPHRSNADPTPINIQGGRLSQSPPARQRGGNNPAAGDSRKSRAAGPNAPATTISTSSISHKKAPVVKRGLRLLLSCWFGTRLRVPQVPR